MCAARTTTVGTAATTTTAAATTTTAAATATATTTTATAIAIATIGSTPLRALRPRRHFHGVEEFATLLRAVRRSLALENAHQADLPRAPADDIESLHHAREPVALNLQRGAHGLRLGPRSQVERRDCLRWRGRLLDRDWILGRCGRGTAFRRGSVLAGRSSIRDLAGSNGLRRRLGGIARTPVGAWRFRARRAGRSLLDLGSGDLWVRGSVGLLRFRRPLHQDSGKLGDGLHGIRPSLLVKQGWFISRVERPS
jgi:hypothetical protein